MVIGDIIYDLVVRLREPLAAGSDTRARMSPHPGGAGANVAAWLARLGMETHLVGRIGRDAFGHALAGELRGDGVILHLAGDAAHPTGQIVILVDAAGERTMITDRGANLFLTRDDVPRELFGPGRHLHLSGYSFVEPELRTVVRTALEWARAAGMTTSLDPASASLLADVGPGRFLAWTRGIDLCFPNRAEGVLLAGVDGAAGVDAIVGALRRHYPHVVLTLGPAGAAYSGPDADVCLPAEPARVVDTTGAGDALCAAFLASWLTGEPPVAALAAGLRLAARVVGQVGARPGATPSRP